MQKSPLLTPKNSQFKCLKGARDKIPPNAVVNSFLFYSGELEFNLAKNDRFIIAHTNKYVVYEFWISLIADSQKVAQIVDYMCPIENKSMFKVYQDTYANFRDPFVRAALFFILNQCSSENLISSGNLASESPSPLSLTYLKNFSSHNFHMKFHKDEDIIDSLKKIPEDEYILIPAGKYSMNLFEEGKLNGLEETKVYHEKIKNFFFETDKKVVLLYYSSPRIFEWYGDCDLKMFNKWGIETDKQSDCEEVVIANF